MGHRAYLLVCTEGLEAELFEANNFLPFFWLTLLDDDHLIKIAPTWQHAEQALLDDEAEAPYDDTWPRPTDIRLTKATLEQNAAKAQAYLLRHLPEQVALYQEFVRYLLAHLPGGNDYLRVDIFALTAFSTSQDLQESLRNQLAAMGQQQALPGGLPSEPTLLTGFVQPPAAIGAEYPALQQLWAQQQRPAPTAQKPKASNSPSRLFYALVGVASGLLGAGYAVYRSQGLVWWVGGLGLMSLLMLVMAVRKRCQKAA